MIIMNDFIKRLVLNKFTSILLLKSSLKVHSFSYKLSAKLATIQNGGVHPKKNIIKYVDWFVDNIKAEWVVLDVGSNNGTMADFMSSKALFVYGLEINPKLTEEAKKNVQKDNVDFVCADATAYDYRSFRPIDCITLSNVLEHIEHRISFIKNVVKNVVWKDNAKKTLLIRVPMIDREWISVYKKEMGIEYRLDTTHFTEYTFLQFSNEMQSSGLFIVSHHVVFGEIYAVCQAY